MNNNLVFICGALRSGSTMLRLMLDNHPNIANPGEFDFLFDYLHEDSSYPDILQFSELLQMNRTFTDKNLSINLNLTSDALVEDFISQLSSANRVLALNVHRHFEHIPNIFPNAKYVHLLRDPRDVAKSCIGMGWAGNVYFGVDMWVATEKSWDLLELKINPEIILTLRYEDLVSQPTRELTRLCQFIGVAYNPAMLEYDNSSTYEKPNNDLAWQWRKKLTAQEANLVDAKAHQLMTKRNYALSGNHIPQLTLFTKLALFGQNKLFKLKHGVTRYGLGLFITEKIARLLRLRKLHKQCVQQKNSIDLKYLK